MLHVHTHTSLETYWCTTAVGRSAGLAAHTHTHTRHWNHTGVLLLQAEAVAELLHARTPQAADSALAGLQGGVGSAVGALRNQVGMGAKLSGSAVGALPNQVGMGAH